MSNSDSVAANGRWILLATILGSSMAFIDGTVVNVALPTLQRDFDASATGVQWVVQAYSLFLAALILVGGSLGDRFGRRRIFQIGVVLFTVASVFCGIAPNLVTLVGARVLQGIGGALLVPGSLAIINAAYRGEARGKAIGTWSGFTSITTAIGPVLGGWLVEHLSWRTVFLMNVPLAVIVVLATIRYVPESRDEEAGTRLDVPGAALITAMLATLIYGLSEATTAGFSSPVVVISLIVCAVTAAGFFVVEHRSANPMVPLGLFRSRAFSATNLLTFFLYAALAGALYFFPFNLIQVQGYSSTAAGAAMLPMILLMFVLSRWAGGLIARYGARLPLTVGPAIAAVAFVAFTIPGIGGQYWTTFFPAVVLLGIGMSVTVAPLTTAVMSAVDDRRSGLASGVNNAVSRAGGVIAIAVLGIVMSATFRGALGNELDALALPADSREQIEADRDQLAGMTVPDTLDAGQAERATHAIDTSFVRGFRVVMIVAAVLSVLAAVAGFLSVSNRRVAND